MNDIKKEEMLTVEGIRRKLKTINPGDIVMIPRGVSRHDTAIKAEFVALYPRIATFKDIESKEIISLTYPEAYKVEVAIPAKSIEQHNREEDSIAESIKTTNLSAS